MIPVSMRKPFWLAPACLASLTLGLFVLVIYFFPEFSPRLHENMLHRGLYVAAPWVSAISILVPVSALWFHTVQTEEE